MPRRLVDGEGIWRSEKIARLPAKWKGEYANLIPLGLDDGCFEADPRKVWSEVYSYNRREVTEGEVAELLDELEAVKLIFRWVESHAEELPYRRLGIGEQPEGKLWAYFIGSDHHVERNAKQGRLLPPAKRRKVGPGVPKKLLKAFLAEEKRSAQIILGEGGNGKP